MVMYEVWAGGGKMPFDDEIESENRHKEDIRKEIARNGLRPALGPLLGPSAPMALNELAILVQKCWSTNPDERPEFKDVVAQLVEIASSFGLKKPAAPVPLPARQPIAVESKASTESLQAVKAWRVSSTVTLAREAGIVTALMLRPTSSEIWVRS
jgi:hypothetical protein